METNLFQNDDVETRLFTGLASGLVAFFAQIGLCALFSATQTGNVNFSTIDLLRCVFFALAAAIGGMFSIWVGLMLTVVASLLGGLMSTGNSNSIEAATPIVEENAVVYYLDGKEIDAEDVDLAEYTYAYDEDSNTYFLTKPEIVAPKYYLDGEPVDGDKISLDLYDYTYDEEANIYYMTHKKAR